MRLGIDLDGVVADFATAANGWLAIELNREPLPVDRWDWYKSYDTPTSPVDEVWERLWSEEVPSGFFLAVSPDGEALSALDVLAAQGHEVVFITARPAAAAADTQRWLEVQGLGGHPLIFTLSMETKRFTDTDLLLDDKGETVLAHLQLAKPAVLFKRPWNREWWSRVPSVSSWGEFVQVVEKLEEGS